MRSEEEAQKEAKFMAMPWKPHYPLVLLTRPIENVQQLVEQSGIQCSDMQLLQKGLSVMCSTRGFEISLTMWKDFPETCKTWAKFKIHFHEAQLSLKKIRGPTIQQAGFHH